MKMVQPKPTKAFSKKALVHLGYYVYALIDPDGSIFYIGKGKGNRAFQHIKEAEKATSLNSEASISKKLLHIKRIKEDGKEVGIYIIRHGLTNEHALIVESVLIDLFRQKKELKLNNVESLDNKINGFQSQGVHTADEINQMYNKEEASILPNEKILAINIAFESVDCKKIYNRVRASWVLDPKRADKADYIVAVHNGFIIGVFQRYENQGWHKYENTDRYCFDGECVKDESVLKRLLHRTLNRSQGSQNPIWYVNGWK